MAKLRACGYLGASPAMPAEADRIYTLEIVEDAVQVTLDGPGGRLATIVPAQDLAAGPVLPEPEGENGAVAESGTQTPAFDPKTAYWAVDLLACRLVHALAEEDGGGYAYTRRRIGNGLPTYAEAHVQPELDIFVEHSKANQILEKLRTEHGSVQIYGATGAGKSVQASLLAYRCIELEHDEIRRIQLDLQDQDDGAESVLAAMLTLPRPEAKWYLVVVENTHNNSKRARQVFELIDRLRRRYGFRIAVLATGGRSLESMPNKPACLRGIWCVAAEPRRVVNKWAEIKGLNSAEKKALRNMSGDGQDISLAHLVLKYYEDNGRSIPTNSQFTIYTAKHFGLDAEHFDLAGVQDSAVRDCLYKFACLGAAEIEMPPSLIRLSYRHIVTRFESLIEQADSTYRIGSRSVAREVARYAFEHWGPRPHPADVIMDHVKLRGDSLIQPLVEGLDLIDLKRDDAGTTSQVLGGVLKTRRQLSDLLAEEARKDEEWRDNVACAAFAAMALYGLGRIEEANRCADFVRDRWIVEPSGVLPYWRDSPTAEQYDFLSLKEMMQEEDELLAGQTDLQGKNCCWPENQRSGQIDLARMHNTWMLGVLLSFEGSVPSPDTVRVGHLFEAAEKAWQPGGGFYPERIPWMTARILIGLCEAGKGDSDLARKAADWLLDWRAPGEKRAMGWASGTGVWNSLAMTNAMCLIALMKCNPTWESTMIDVGYQHMMSAIDAQPGPEDEPLDYALMIEALLLAERAQDRERAYGLLPRLLDWISRGDAWTYPRVHRSGLGPREIKVESTELPFTASQLVPCVRSMVVDKLYGMYKEYIDGPGTTVEPTPVTEPETLVPDPRAEQVPIALREKASRGIDLIIVPAIAENIESRQRTLRQMPVNGHTQPVNESTLYRKMLEFEDYRLEMEGLRRQFEDGPVTARLIVAIDDLGVRVNPRVYNRCIPESEADMIRSAQPELLRPEPAR